MLFAALPSFALQKSFVSRHFALRLLFSSPSASWSTLFHINCFLCSPDNIFSLRLNLFVFDLLDISSSEPMERVVCDQEREEIRIIFHLSVSGDGCLWLLPAILSKAKTPAILNPSRNSVLRLRLPQFLRSSVRSPFLILVFFWHIMDPSPFRDNYSAWILFLGEGGRFNQQTEVSNCELEISSVPARLILIYKIQAEVNNPDQPEVSNT